VRPSFADSPEFHRLIRGEDDVRLVRIALEIARDAYPDLDVDAYLERVKGLAERVRARCPSGAKVRDVLGQINWALYVEEKLRGNEEDYYDPRNSYLNEVLDRRLGIPISLAALYWSVAEQLGLPVAGVNLPAHFMLRVEEGNRTLFVDAFHSGDVLDREACERRLSEIAKGPVILTDPMTSACPLKVVVIRMLRNLKTIYWNSHDIVSALPVQRRLVALNPKDPQELRDLGVLCAQAERLGEAIDPLQAYLDSSPPDGEAEEILALLKVIRRQVAQWN
jgi:regulator of sirC expression with transglutaminase-like and TPR domain